MTLDNVLFIGGLWLGLAAVGTLMYDGVALDYTQTFARAILWPFALPLVFVKVIFILGSFGVNVIKELPEAIGDIWRWK